MDIKKLNEQVSQALQAIENKKLLLEDKKILAFKGNIKDVITTLKDLAKAFGDNISINEVIKKLKNDLKEDKNGIVFNGKKQDIQQLLQDLTAQYGNLTIPEFIDKLIQAEKQGEQILDENLKEYLKEDVDAQDQEWLNNVNNFVKEVKKVKFKDIDICYQYDWKECTGTGCIDLQITPVNSFFNYGTARAQLGVLKLAHTTKDVNIPAAYVYIHQLEKKNGALATNCAVIDFRIPSYTDHGTYNIFEYDIREEFFRILIKQEGFEKSPYTYYHIGPQLSGSVCFEMDSLDDVQELKYFVKLFTRGLQTALQELSQKRAAEKQAKIDNFNSAKKEFEELAKAKRQARANKRAANTTIKQALSKTAVIKKIQSLQGVTPEQLAKILAAIED